jgi:hypothetical protein
MLKWAWLAPLCIVLILLGLILGTLISGVVAVNLLPGPQGAAFMMFGGAIGVFSGIYLSTRLNEKVTNLLGQPTPPPATRRAMATDPRPAPQSATANFLLPRQSPAAPAGGRSVVAGQSPAPQESASNVSPPRQTRHPSEADEIARHRRNLLLKTLHDEEKIERLLQGVRNRYPGLREVAVYQKVIDQWEQDLR